MGWLLNAVYALVLIASMPWMAWRAIWTGRYREGWMEKLFGRIPIRESQRDCLWLHAVSVGEVQLLRPLVLELTKKCNHELVISTTTRTGLDLAKRLFPNHQVFYCPWDFTWAVRSALHRIRPAMLILVELELWPNWIAQATKSGCKVVVVNGRLSERSFRGYQRLGKWLRPLFASIDWVGVQDPIYAQRFQQLGTAASKIQVTGSMKFDGAELDRNHPEIVARRKILGLNDSHWVWVVGSTQSPEEKDALNAYRKAVQRFPALKMIVVPRHPERFDEVAQLLNTSQIAWRRRSEIDGCLNADDWQVLLADSIGELRWWWGMAEIGFVGGSFGKRGGQNMIEPAAFGVCTSFGPNTKNFRDIVRLLLDAEAVTVLDEPDQMLNWVESMLSNRRAAQSLGSRARGVALAHRGATQRTVAELANLLSNSVQGRSRAA